MRPNTGRISQIDCEAHTTTNTSSCGMRARGKAVFVTARESRYLLGPRVFRTIKALESVAAQVCVDCGGACCRRIACGFYHPEFERCPIYAYRPAKCRLYFCEKVLESPLLTESQRQILDGPAGDLADYLHYNSGLESGRQSPVVRILEKDWLDALGLQIEISAILSSLSRNHISAERARGKLMHLVRTFRCNSRSAQA